MAIIRYNVTEEEHFGDNVYLIHRPYILSNPYTHIKDKKTKAMFVVSTKEEAIERYSHYFDTMYGTNILFTKVVDDIYALYRSGQDVFIGCYCDTKKNDNCHGDIIIKKLQSRLVKEKLAEVKKSREKFGAL